MHPEALNMPTIGIAGVTIPGAVDCISKINQYSHEFFPDPHHPNIILYQPNFISMQRALLAQDWKKVLEELLASLEFLAKSGSTFAIIPANTVHKVISDVERLSPIPVVNMLAEVAAICLEQNVKKLGIMGTLWTMKGHLYQETLHSCGVEEIIPTDKEQEIVQNAIFSELIPTGKASPPTLSALLKITHNLKKRGCDAVALACTELPLALNQANCGMPILDATEVLAKAALKKAVNLMGFKRSEEFR